MVVNAARVSFNKTSTELTAGDKKLITYLATHNHVTPFFHPQIQFRFKMPIFLAREWFRHQIGFARNEVSRRYVDERPDMFEPQYLRKRDSNKKQGSKEDPVEYNGLCMELMQRHSENSIDLYETLLANDVCPEQARMVLPQSMYTEFIETGSLAAYARLCKLRLDPHAQKEIREYAQLVSDILAEKFPVSWNALIMSGTK
jgi:thymidylate synthase (FAD)